MVPREVTTQLPKIMKQQRHIFQLNESTFSHIPNRKYLRFEKVANAKVSDLVFLGTHLLVL